MHNLAWPNLTVGVRKPVVVVVQWYLPSAPLGQGLLRVVVHCCIELVQVERVSEPGSRRVPGDLVVVVQET